MCDMTHSYVWHDSFICVTWLIHMCDMTHSYVSHDSFIRVTCLIHMCDMTYTSSICETWLISENLIIIVNGAIRVIYKLIYMWHEPRPTHMRKRKRFRAHPYAWYDAYSVNEWVMSHVWMSHVTHMNESCHVWYDAYSVARTHRMPYLSGRFSQKSPIISGIFAKIDLQLKASFGSLPPCTRNTDNHRDMCCQIHPQVCHLHIHTCDMTHIWVKRETWLIPETPIIVVINAVRVIYEFICLIWLMTHSCARHESCLIHKCDMNHASFICVTWFMPHS